VLRFGQGSQQDELSLFGTVGTGATNVVCVRGGPLILLAVAPTGAAGTRVSFSKTTYRLGRHGFSWTGTRRIVGTNARIAAIAHRAGFDRLPFTGCAVARGRRL
jgi:hypothetical protein